MWGLETECNTLTKDIRAAKAKKGATKDKEAPKDEAEKDDTPKVTFKELGLMPEILRALDDVGYTHPTPIQAGTIEAALQRKDVLGIAQTGTGKTGAFTLPIIQSLAKGRARARMPRCLIVCPTRELAAQVAENVELYSKYLKISMALLIGGVSFAKQEALLNRGVDVLIATPGRLLDHFGRGKVMLSGVQALVVDEADRMLDMGFIPDIEEIFKKTPFTRQVLFFSATMAPEIQRLVDQFLHQPHIIKIARKNITAKTVKQMIVRMPGNDNKQKRTALRYIIDNHKVKNGIVFCNRKVDVDIVAKSLTVHGHNAAPIHGDLRQSQRMETLAGFKNGDIEFLVASDVAARGLDIPDVSHVFNYDVPSHSEDYVHRIGRTGRAGRKGEAIMFVTPRDKVYYQDILKLINFKEIEEIEIPGIKDFATTSSRHKSSGGRGSKGKGGKYGNRGGRNSSRSRGRSDNRNDNKNAETKSAKPANQDKQKPQDRPQEKASNSRYKPAEGQKKQTSQKQPAQKQSVHKPGQTNKPQQNNQQKRGRRGDLPTNKKSGFGDSMPAFFGGDD
ncbi:MAG: DEAD/DEAH box helicase [Robiginitomaculum sp.]|nr:DEAD/DEAH box helicase [Robiginitomaculum sp.]